MRPPSPAGPAAQRRRASGGEASEPSSQRSRRSIASRAPPPRAPGSAYVTAFAPAYGCTTACFASYHRGARDHRVAAVDRDGWLRVELRCRVHLGARMSRRSPRRAVARRRASPRTIAARAITGSRVAAVDRNGRLRVELHRRERLGARMSRRSPQRAVARRRLHDGVLRLALHRGAQPPRRHGRSALQPNGIGVLAVQQ